MLRKWFPLPFAVLLGCANETSDSASQDSGAPRTPADDPCLSTDCSNVIDAVIVRKLAESGIAMVKEDDAVLCRRMAMDLTGMPPSPEELAAHCVGHPPKEIADWFMTKSTNAVAFDGSPPYEFVNRRFWADNFFGDYGTGGPYGTFVRYIRELDTLVGDLYGGRIRYDAFTPKVLASPGFIKVYGHFTTFGQNDAQNVAKAAIGLFLGRVGLPAELDDFANLFRSWSYAARDGGTKWLVGHLMGNKESYALYPDAADCGTKEVREEIAAGVEEGHCMHPDVGLDGSLCAGMMAGRCQSSAFGAAAVVPTQETYVRYYDLSDEDKKRIEAPGRLMMAQPELAEHAADLALTKYLGWWGAGSYKPDYDVPAVRTALAKAFAGEWGWDIRRLEREIVTSVLYAQAAKRPNAGRLPLWAAGPTKGMSAVMWFDAVSLATTGSSWSREFRGASYNGIVEARVGTNGLVSMFNRRQVLAESFCAAMVAPKGSSPESIVDGAFAKLGRPASTDERAILLGELRSGSDGCALGAPCNTDQTGLDQIAQQLCRSLFASAIFINY